MHTSQDFVEQIRRILADGLLLISLIVVVAGDFLA